MIFRRQLDQRRLRVGFYPGKTLGRRRLFSWARREEGFTLMEVTVGTAILGLVASTALASLTVLNKSAISSRVMSAAREIVQRNIENAVGSPFTTTSQPSILQVTGANGAVWDEAGGTGQVTIYSTRDGTDPTIQGTLTRTVLAESNTPGADIRRVKFHLDYILFGRALSYEITTLRAIDK